MSTTMPTRPESMLYTGPTTQWAILECEECDELMGWDDGAHMLRAALAAWAEHTCPTLATRKTWAVTGSTRESRADKRADRALQASADARWADNR